MTTGVGRAWLPEAALSGCSLNCSARYLRSRSPTSTRKDAACLHKYRPMCRCWGLTLRPVHV